MYGWINTISAFFFMYAYVYLYYCIMYFNLTRLDGIPVLWSGFAVTFARLCPNIIITYVAMEMLSDFFNIQSLSSTPSKNNMESASTAVR